MTNQAALSARRPVGVRTRRRTLLWSCAATALIVAAGSAKEAKAQAFQGNPVQPGPNVATSGTATRDITSSTTETITVGSPTATIDWTPFDNDGSGTIDFLPAGNVATFTNDPDAVANFTVLNRIVPLDVSRPIALNGTVLSQLQDLSNNTTTGGNVWFYSPGGIIVGAQAVFNVGGLLLTVNNPLTFNQTANGFTGHFASATDSTASVTITKGAQINATPENSYVAIVAPRIVQNGNVSVNGAAAYVAGEDVTLTMNQGLFDIAVDVGTTDPEGVVHQGSTGGPASTGAGDNHRIYMVAVPKNQALTMFLAGNAGFTPASSASLDNGQIVLSAGSTVAETSGTLVVTSPNGIDADLTIETGNYTSDVRAFARGDIDVTADTGNIAFARDVSLRSLLAGANGKITFGASGGNSLTVGRNALLVTSGATFTSASEIEVNSTGGTIDIGGNLSAFVGAAADGTIGDVDISASDDIDNHGSIGVAGTTLVSTTAGATAPTNPDADSTNNFAGDIFIDAFNGGTIALHDTNLLATANGQDNNGNGSGFAGAGFGGNINVTANDGTIGITGNLFATVDGIGGNLLGAGPSAGGGFGGGIFVGSYSGDLAITGNMFLSALGSGGDDLSGTNAASQGGFGSGGFIQVFNGGPDTLTVAGVSTLRADGSGGDGQTGGDGFGGTAGIYGYDGTIALGPTIDISAHGTGGNASSGFGGDGGDGFGGTAYIEARAQPGNIEVLPTASTITGGNATLDAGGTGGTGGAGNGDNLAAGSGGDGFGGAQCQGECSSGGAYAIAQVDGASLTLGDVTLNANGNGGAGGAGGNDQPGGAGGNGTGGTTQVGLSDDPFSPTGAADGQAHYGNILALASGNGGNGGTGGSSIGGPLPDGDGGTGQGGSASLWSNNLVTALSATFFANGNGGDGGNGGNAFGGSSSITSDDAFIFINDVLTRFDGLVDIDGVVTLEAAAASGNGSTGSTGNASGGTAQLLANGGDINVGVVFISADGDAEDGVFGGTGEGGLAAVDAYDGANLTAASLTVQALGEGGSGSASAGSGEGGTARIRAHSGASITTGAVTADASGRGGNSIDGGTGLGGLAEASAFEQDSTLDVAGLVTVVANGTGGTGSATGSGGTGYGGSANLYAGVGDSGTGGATVTLGSALVQANGTGGSGGAGGSGFGGGDPAETSGVRIGARLGTLTIIGTLNADADGIGGAGIDGAGGQGLGGNILVGANFVDDVGVATASLGDADLSANGIGGAGGGSGNSGGNGTGGRVEVSGSTNGSNINAASLSLNADGTGGAGATAFSGGSGGTGQGGHTLIDIAAGAATLGDIQANARGFGGAGGDGTDSFGADGGSAFGGLTEFNAGANLAGTSYDSLVTATGGGAGVGTTRGNGGSAEAGDAYFSVFGGVQADFTGSIILDATATGGAGDTGGAASAGFTDVLVSGTLNVGDIQEIAQAFGGTGNAIGGDATGGRSYLEIAGGVLNVSGQTHLLDQGIGGDGSNFGGNATGGQSQVFVSNNADANFGTAMELHADASGGSAPLGFGGTATGGSAAIFATSSDLSGGALTLTATGNQGFVDLDLSGSNLTVDSVDLNANGTTAGTVTVLLQSDFFGTPSSLTTSSFNAFADGVTAGDIFVTVNDGSIADLGTAQLSTVGSSGGSINIDIGAPTILGQFAGLVPLDLLNAPLTADSLSLITSGDVNITSVGGASIDVVGLFDIDAGGALTAEDNDQGGVIHADVIDWHANTVTNNFDLVGRVVGIAADLDLDVTTTTIVADETIDLSAGGDLTAGDLSTGLLINLNAGNDISAGNLDSGGDILADAGGNITTGNLTAGGNIDLDAFGDILFGDVDTDTFAFSADGTVTGGNIVANRKVTGDAGGAVVLGDITVGPGPEVPGDFSVGIASATSITVGDVNSFGRVGFATLGDLTTGDIVAGPLFLTLVSGDVTAGSVTTDPTGRVYMADASMFLANGGPDNFDPAPVLASAPVPTGGSITINGPVSTGRFQAAAGTDLNTAAITAGQSIEMSAGNGIFTGDLDAGTTVTLDAGTGFGVNNVDAGTSATFTTGGVATFFGLVSAPTITVTSGDIDIFGQLGEFGVTNLVTLNALSDGAPILIGGVQSDLTAALVPDLQYWLASDEEIQADSIVFNASGVDIPTPDVLVSDFEIEGSQTAGGGVHNVELNTDGRVLVGGLLAYSSAGASDLLAINASDIQIDTSAGGRIAMVDTTLEAPSGILELTADNIWVGDETLLANLNTDPNFAGRDDAIGTNSGAPVPEGFLIADGMTLSVGNSLFVQNSGAPDDFAGITVGDGGLTIVTTGEVPAEVVAYGRKFNSDGTFTTGNDFFDLVDFTFSDGSTYTDLSEFNECLINIGCTVVINEPPGSGPGPEDILGPIDLMNDPQEETEGLTDDENELALRDNPDSQLIDTGDLGSDELVDEGVTSGGDNNKWNDEVCPADPTNSQRCSDKDGEKQEP